MIFPEGGAADTAVVEMATGWPGGREDRARGPLATLKAAEKADQEFRWENQVPNCP